MTASGSPASRGSETTVVAGLPHDGGIHCETTTLGVLLTAAGVHLSEPALLGLGGGLSFIYWDSTRQALPFLGGRVKPFALTENVASRLGLDLRVQETASPRRAWENVATAIDAGVPVGLQLDSYDLDYFTSRVHFAGHIVAMYGYDDTTAYLIDTAQQGGRVRTSRASLERARAARGPMSARHRSFTLGAADAPAPTELPLPAALQATAACAREFLAPPIANLGHRGIRTAAVRVRSLFGRVEDPPQDLATMATLMERAGTGGALFRNLYRDFLTEIHELLPAGDNATAIATGRDAFAESALLWTDVARLLERAGATGDQKHLAEASRELEKIADLETAAMSALRTVADDTDGV